MKLNEVAFNEGSRKNSKRVGRGIGSGTGKTAGSGHKGQKARSGVAIKGFEGGQMPIYQRLPKRGFVNIFRNPYSVIRIDLLQKAIDNKKIDVSKTITREILVESGLINRKAKRIKLLANVKDKFTTKISIEVDAASKAASEIVHKAGGKVLLLLNDNTAATENVESADKSSKTKSNAAKSSKPKTEKKST